ncbi:DUF1850 domain-containing protein [Psychrobacillus antarcticus]|uniref:DUF1850 domain-containing protein n=1 Tax=Psychrobacillus antarcticus TaxID=2879115 RepID=UPI00240808C4|nr:DUF1850 domain-containing protein [Psychrobacillus antarcticus]
MNKLIGVVLIFLFIGFCFIPIFTAFTFTETKTEHETIHYITKDKQDIFQITFTHTIHLTDVIESYRVIESNNIQLVSMEYSNVAIGMPGYAEEGQTLSYENGVYTLKYDKAVLNDFILHIGDVDNKLDFFYNKKSFDLKEELDRGKSYEFEVKKISLFEKVKGVQLNER